MPSHQRMSVYLTLVCCSSVDVWVPELLARCLKCHLMSLAEQTWAAVSVMWPILEQQTRACSCVVRHRADCVGDGVAPLQAS